MSPSEESIASTIAEEFSLEFQQVLNTLEMFSQGNTLPFITRYRKEVTGGLDELAVRKIKERAEYLLKLLKRKKEILNYIDSQGKLTKELATSIEEALTVEELDDLFRPFFKEEKTKAIIAREKGLEPLAKLILSGEVAKGNPEEIARKFVNAGLGVPSVALALEGAIEIVAETISDNAQIRSVIREVGNAEGMIVTVGDERLDPEGNFKDYYNYQDPLLEIPPHRVLAINRAREKGVVRIEVRLPNQKILEWLQRENTQSINSIFIEQLDQAIIKAYNDYILPAIQDELLKKVIAKAEGHAFKIFATNLRKLLLQPPLRGANIMGIDPGYRTGCKIALIDKSGKVLKDTVIYPHSPSHRELEAKEILKSVIKKYHITVIVIGNGTASRETEELIAEIIPEIPREDLGYIIVNEAGASVYSVSETAREEFPEKDPTIRSAIHIARRLLDPLSELVKIDPKSIGVGLYQHDVDQQKLSGVLAVVVESCVNNVGVNINTASANLLCHVSGLNYELAKAIVDYREKQGKFRSREDILSVPKMTEEIYNQAVGFLKVIEGDNPLDETFIHPESYDVALKLLEKINATPYDPDLAKKISQLKAQLVVRNDLLTKLGEELGIGIYTLRDIINNLEKPRFDPRDGLPKPILRNELLSFKDLQPDMILEGIVKNVVDFGAFIDIGLKVDGLVHISEMSDDFISSPYSILSVGDRVKVRVLSVDRERERISLSMRELEDK